MKKYTLPPLPYAVDALAPLMSAAQLALHHDKHHQAYVDGANNILDKLVLARQSGAEIDLRAMLKALSFNIGGHLLHSLFWTNLTPANLFKEPEGKLLEKISADFGSLDRLKIEFNQTGATVEGSGWAALVYDSLSDSLLISQIEKHNCNLHPGATILLVVDMFEHSYYLDYQNDRAKYLTAFWQMVNWPEVERRLN